MSVQPPLAHVAGVPVEELAGSLPALIATGTMLVALGRQHVRALRARVNARRAVREA